MVESNNPTNGEHPPPPEPPKRRGRPPGSKNKPKSPPPAGDDFKGTDRAAGSDSTENNPNSERAQNLKKGIAEMENFATQRIFLAQAQSLVDRINSGFDEADETGRKLLHIVRATGILLLEWKANVGHANWMDSYETSGFKKSLATAENWMRLSLLTDDEIAKVSSIREALNFLKDKKKQAKKTKPDSNPESKPEPEPARAEIKKRVREKINNALTWLGKPRKKKDVDFWALDLEGE